MSRPKPSCRDDFVKFSQMTTRWHDNDIYGHVNNSIHYQLFDTAVNGYLLENNLLSLQDSATVFLVVETSCVYFSELKFPNPIECGLRVEKIGSSSVTYRVGLFGKNSKHSAAEGKFVHVNVDRLSRKPVPLSSDAKLCFERMRNV